MGPLEDAVVIGGLKEPAPAGGRLGPEVNRGSSCFMRRLGRPFSFRRQFRKNSSAAGFRSEGEYGQHRHGRKDQRYVTHNHGSAFDRVATASLGQLPAPDMRRSQAMAIDASETKPSFEISTPRHHQWIDRDQFAWMRWHFRKVYYRFGVTSRGSLGTILGG